MATKFVEIARVNVADNRDIVISNVMEDGNLKGININSFVTTMKYTGYTKGTFIPVDKVHDFVTAVRNLDI